MTKRNAVVLASLLGSLVLTSVLLLALAPAPLNPDAVRSLLATDSFDKVFQTPAAIERGRWQYIYMHHSREGQGSAATMSQQTGDMGDHFLIGNGQGCGDGEIQVGYRWDQQKPARPMGANVNDDCISICLVGDFDQTAPTSAQMRQLGQLVRSLQREFGIGSKGIVAVDRASSPAGIGRHFPAQVLREALVP
jgi:hypothetical protein